MPKPVWLRRVPVRHRPHNNRHRRAAGACGRGFGRRFFMQALEHELLLRPIGKTVYWMPPYCVAEEEIESLVRGLDVCLTV